MMTLDEAGGWSALLGELTAGHDLDAARTRAALDAILAGQATDAQIAAFIVGLRMKGETIDEMAGLVEAARAVAVPLDLPVDTIDIVGVGGAHTRRKHAFNVSTLASFVASGAGARVCKHGNRKASSTSGSFDLLEALGVNIEIGAEQLSDTVNRLGVGFAFARAHHPSFRYVGPVRAELGVPTVFNVLGPLSHPGRVTRQVIGVADSKMALKMAHVLAATGSIRSMVVTGAGPLDELTTYGPSSVVDLDNLVITESVIDARDYGFSESTADDVRGGDVNANVALARSVLGGEPSAHRDIVVLNAAAGLVVAGVAAKMADGVRAAQVAIDEGAAQAKLEALVAEA